MKRTITTLMALAGAASAEIPPTNVPHVWGGAAAVDKLGPEVKLITTENNTLGVSRETHTDIAWGRGDVTDVGTVVFSGTYTVGQNGSFATSTGTTVRLENVYDMNAGDITLSFIAQIGENSTGQLITFGETDNYSYTISVGADGLLGGISVVGYDEPTVDVKSAVNLRGTHDYVLSWASPAYFENSGISDRNKRVITLFVDGQLALETSVFSREYNAAYITSYTFGGNGVSGNFSNVSFHRGAIMVPEPATATLSLLALVGLAARRRRK